MPPSPICASARESAMALALPERCNWVGCCPSIAPGKEGLLHTGAGQGPQPCSWGASGWAVGLGPGLSCKSWMIPLTSWHFPLQPKSSTSFQVGKWGNRGPSGWDGGWGRGGGGWGSSLRGWASLLGAGPGPQPRPGHLPAGTEDYQLNSECNSDVVCPHKCRCEAGVAECSSLRLTKIPERIPQSTAEL